LTPAILKGGDAEKGGGGLLGDSKRGLPPLSKRCFFINGEEKGGKRRRAGGLNFYRAGGQEAGLKTLYTRGKGTPGEKVMCPIELRGEHLGPGE